MARAGRKPKPTHLKLLQGNPGKRAINKDEPTPPRSSRVRVPSHLSKVAKTEYRRTAKLLSDIGVLTDADHRALELYAETFAIWKFANEKMRDPESPGDLCDLVTEMPSGYKAQHAYLSIANAASKRMQSLLSEFGMTPSSRSRVTAIKPARNAFDDMP